MRDDRSEFVKSVFGPDGLRVVDPDVAARLALPDRSKQYLITVGLPCGKKWVPPFDFSLVDRLPTLFELYPEERGRLDPAWKAMRFLRLEYDVGVYLDLADGGTVWHVDLRGESKDQDDCFMNSSVEFLGYFLAECNCPHPDTAGGGRDERRTRLTRITQNMREADPRAMADAGHFWPLFIEDAELRL